MPCGRAESSVLTPPTSAQVSGLRPSRRSGALELLRPRGTDVCVCGRGGEHRCIYIDLARSLPPRFSFSLLFPTTLLHSPLPPPFRPSTSSPTHRYLPLPSGFPLQLHSHSHLTFACFPHSFTCLLSSCTLLFGLPSTPSIPAPFFQTLFIHSLLQQSLLPSPFYMSETVSQGKFFSLFRLLMRREIAESPAVSRVVAGPQSNCSPFFSFVVAFKISESE